MLRGIIKIMIIGSNKQDKGDSLSVSVSIRVNNGCMCVYDDAISDGTE